MQRHLAKNLFCHTRFPFVFSIHRLFSTSLSLAEAVSENPPTRSSFAAEYLVKSCGFSMDKAIETSKKIPQLRSPVKPDSILHFFREYGLTDADIRKVVTRSPNILCASLESTIKPKLIGIQEIGFSPSQISQLLSLTKILSIGKHSMQRNIEFLMPFVGSPEGILIAIKRGPFLLNVDVEKVIKPNVSFLEEHCQVTPSQIRAMMIRAPSLFTMNPNKLKKAAQRAEELGSPPGSGSFIYALQIASSWTPSQIDAKIKNFMNLGFSEKEVGLMIKTMPMVLTNVSERIRKSIRFLTSEAGLHRSYIATHPALLSYSLERRLIPRHYVMKSLESKGLGKKLTFGYPMTLSDEKFSNKFVKPYKDVVPEVVEAYEAALAGKISLDKLR